MLKRCCILIFLLIALGTLVGCQQARDPDVDALAHSLLDSVIQEEMLYIAPDRLNRFYSDLDSSILSSVTVYKCAEAILADEIAIFQVKQANQMPALRNTLANHYAEQTEIYASYAPVEADRIRKRLAWEKGRWLIIVISADNQQAEQLIESAFK